MESKIKDYFTRVISSILVLSLFISCVPQVSGKGTITRDALMSESMRMIDEHYDEVRTILINEGEYTEEDFIREGYLDGESVTRSAESNGGEAYLDFLYSSDKFEDVDEVLKKAKPLLSEADYKDLEAKAKEIEENIYSKAEDVSRSLSPGQKQEFYKDLRKLVVKSVVLLTAAIVYAFVPKMVFWGKICAATAVSVAAGVLASTIITIVEWSDKDTVSNENTFQDWLESVATDPMANWALAEGIINAQAAVSNSPIVAAIVLGVFAIYGVIDSVKAMSKKYNFKA